MSIRCDVTNVRRIAFSGGRDEDAIVVVYDILAVLHPTCTVIVGCCPTGVDENVRFAAKCFGFNTIVKKADWPRFGRAAGPIRNREIVLEKPELLIAIHSNLQNSKGTRDCVHQHNEAGIPVVVLDPKNRAGVEFYGTSRTS